MRVRMWIDGKFREPEIILCASEETDGLRRLKEAIERGMNRTLTGFRGDEARLLPLRDVARIYAQKDRVLADCNGEVFVLREKLYELEEKLAEDSFVRISRSELVNLKKIEKLDFSVTGTIRIFLLGGEETYVSRRNVTKIKGLLGL